MCHIRGWRIVVLGCSERRLSLWSNATVLGRKLTPVPIGRDVVIDVATFDMVGRKYRNLRQAVQRTRNFGVTTEVVDEQGLDRRSARRTDRGHPRVAERVQDGARILDVVSTARWRAGYPGIALIIARDGAGRVQGFHRYATAGGGAEVTLDVPWRRRGAPNGIDERLSVDMITNARRQGAQRLSLAFAAFPEIFTDKHRNLRPQPRLHGGASRRPADRARVALPLSTEVPCAGRPALRDGDADPGGAAADRAVVARVHRRGDGI